MEYSFIISDIGQEEIILKDKSGTLIKWPKAKLPSNLEIGDEIFFHLSSDKNQETKDILNEILNPEEG